MESKTVYATEAARKKYEGREPGRKAKKYRCPSCEAKKGGSCTAGTGKTGTETTNKAEVQE